MRGSQHQACRNTGQLDNSSARNVPNQDSDDSKSVDIEASSTWAMQAFGGEWERESGLFSLLCCMTSQYTAFPVGRNSVLSLPDEAGRHTQGDMSLRRLVRPAALVRPTFQQVKLSLRRRCRILSPVSLLRDSSPRSRLPEVITALYRVPWPTADLHTLNMFAKPT